MTSCSICKTEIDTYWRITNIAHSKWMGTVLLCSHCFHKLVTPNVVGRVRRLVDHAKAIQLSVPPG